MRRLRVGILDIVSRGPTKALYARVMNANLASIMPQVLGVWCKQEGHDVTLVCYTGFEDLLAELPSDIDIIFIGAFTEAAHTAYALSNLFRMRGAVTVLGGSHARCYPEDAAQHFDYVCGFTDQEALRDILRDCSQHRPIGMQVASRAQPRTLPGVRERWEFIEPTLKKAPVLKMVPMLTSLGCPYTCAFCIDAVVPYQPMELDGLREDLRFLRTKFKQPMVAWHDPNFGVKFDAVMDMIEEAAPAGSIDFLAESSLSLLSEPHLKRLKANNFRAVLPGVESWYDMGGKSKTGGNQGMDKVRQVSDHVNQILRYIPYVQTNFVFGLDCDDGAEPFELTKRFLDMTPGAFPAYSLLTAFGRAAALNLDYQRAGRVVPFPFHFLNNNQAMNVRPRNYSWQRFYDHVIDLSRYSFSGRAIMARLWATTGVTSRWMNVVRAISSEGWGRCRYHEEIRHRMDTDPELLPFFEQETTQLPHFYANQVRKDLGSLWEWLPEGALHHDPNAYLKSEEKMIDIAAG
jgi:hypothetical protein